MLKTSLRSLFVAAASLTALPGASLPGANAAQDAQTFTVLIENISTDRTLVLPDGSTRSVPVAPGAFAVVRDGVMLFRPGQPADADGLESLAEDGNADPLIATLKAMKGVRTAGFFAPGLPFDVTARPGDRLVLTAMFVDSNDLFYAPGPGGIALFDSAEQGVAGDVSGQIQLWDAGTEVNEAPGVGPNQAPRQKQANVGPAETGAVQAVNDGFTYPSTAEVLEVTVTRQ